MLNSRFRALVAVMAFATAALAACGGGDDDDDKASVRLVNATARASLDLLANGDLIVDDTAKDTASEYVDVDTGSPSLQINDATTNAVLAVTAPTVTGGQKFALLAYEVGGAVRTAVITEGTALPPANTAIVRVFNAATDAGSIDVYVTDPAVDITTLSSPTFSFTASTSVQASNFASFGAPSPAGGTYRIRVTGAGNPSDLRLDIPQVILLNQRVATVILTPTAGGTLANGSVLVEDGPLHRHPQHQRPGAPGRRGHERRFGLGHRRLGQRQRFVRHRHQCRRAGDRHLCQRPVGQRAQHHGERRRGRRTDGHARRRQRHHLDGPRQRRPARPRS